MKFLSAVKMGVVAGVAAAAISQSQGLRLKMKVAGLQGDIRDLQQKLNASRSALDAAKCSLEQRRSDFGGAQWGKRSNEEAKALIGELRILKEKKSDLDKKVERQATHLRLLREAKKFQESWKKLEPKFDSTNNKKMKLREHAPLEKDPRYSCGILTDDETVLRLLKYYEKQPLQNKFLEECNKKLKGLLQEQEQQKEMIIARAHRLGVKGLCVTELHAKYGTESNQELFDKLQELFRKRKLAKKQQEKEKKQQEEKNASSEASPEISMFSKGYTQYKNIVVPNPK